MNRINTNIFPTLVLSAAPLAAALAAPGTISDSPLFLKSAVQPNIMFMLDDSGSMDWEILLSNGALAAYPGNTNSGNLDFTPNNSEEEMELCHAYNVMAYNPNRSYTPWIGKDINGDSFTDQTDLSAAVDNPYLGTGYWAWNWFSGWTWISATTDLSNHYYMVWDDADGDGVFDAGECPTHGNNQVNTVAECRALGSSECVAVADLSAAEQINYANWYSYYRKREYVAKRAMSQVIAESSARMGFSTINEVAGSFSLSTPVKNVNDLSTPVDATAAANKEALLDNLFQVDSSGGTPLRDGLDFVGKYYADTYSGDWSSPILSASDGGECQQNFTVLMSDGFWNGNYNGVGNADADDSSSPWDGGSYADSWSNTLADIAMHYYETDLDTNLSNKVKTVAGVDENDAQHMVTYTVAFGINGTLGSNPPDTTTSFPWPEPVADDLTTVDDMRHAAWNGRGEFLSAQDPQELVNGLSSALASISGRTGSASSVAFNTGTLSTNSEVYLALFNSERWSGDLIAYPLDPVTGDILSTANWSAADVLDSRNIGSSPRTILTYNGTDGIPMQWSSLTTDQQSDLRTNSSGAQDNVATGMARLDYIRGQRACEPDATGTCSYTDGTDTYTTKGLRKRDSRLGDIVHSGPVFVGTPESGWPDIAPFPTGTGNTYTEFKFAQASRPGVVYVGANDGMLHAFSQSDGSELLAYVPSSLFSSNTGEGLHYLTETGYGHRYYVDLTPSISDAYIRTSTTGSEAWRTVLVGGLRNGGRGLFALDVTDPTVFSESGTAPQDLVLWEFTNQDDSDLGYSFSRPSIVPLEGSSGSIRWAAIFGNGYNDTGSGEAKLFILFLEGGLDGTWTANTDYIEITTGAGDSSNRNGLATPAVIDSDGDGLADRVYAGDLQGNLWVFDLSGSNTNQWKSAYKSGSTPEPLFTTGTNQPITATPVIVRNNLPTTSSNSPNTLVIFGTGQYLTQADITTTDTQSMYGVWDQGTSNLDRSDLIEQVISTGTNSEGVAGRKLTDNTVDYTSSPPDYGWYMDFTSGERVVTDAVIRGDLVFFNTTIPDSSPCNFGGTGWLMVAKWENGGRPDTVAFDLNGDLNLGTLDQIDGEAAAGMLVTGLPTSPVNLSNKRYVSTTDTSDGDSIEDTTLKEVSSADTGRLSWEELVQ